MSVPKMFRTIFALTCAAALLLGCTGVRGSSDEENDQAQGPTDESKFNVVASPLVVNYETTADLTLESDLIVRATVREILDSFLVYPGEPPFEGNPEYFGPTVYTDVVLMVSEFIKGSGEKTIRIRQVGGTVDGLSFEMLSEPEFTVGDELLLFLRDDSDLGYGDDVYWVVGVFQGFWKIGANGDVQPEDEKYGPRNLQDFREELTDYVSSE